LNRAKKTASLHQKSKVVQDLRQKKREKKERKSARERERMSSEAKQSKAPFGYGYYY